MNPMRWPSQLQAQLIGVANSADRANRPTMFVALPGIAVIGALVVLLVVFARFADARRVLESRERDAASLKVQLTGLEERRSRQPDLASTFPQNALFGDSVQKTAEEVWGVAPNELPVSVGQPKSTPFFITQVDLKKTDVACTVRSPTRFDLLAQWIDRVLHLPHLKGVFLAKLELHPAPTGWTGQVVFRRYEYIPN